ncbi:UbiA prenyltransferase family-domain-containing protein [Auriculariales sp. MPI-PUGE-AT-0066]|nr:UbiA prenyltransferase family-domain-containing protein [Auriculariales sp. MPI-PUGE-AT-0066]
MANISDTPAAIPIAQHRNLFYHIYTLFLFTCRDIKSVVIPHTIFAISGTLARQSIFTPIHHPSNFWDIIRSLPQTLVWIWICLLMVNISNQRLTEAILEDKVNRAWRPLPAGRISQTEAAYLLATGIPITIGISYYLGVLVPGIACLVISWLYSEFDLGSASAIGRSILCGVWVASFNAGALGAMANASLENLSPTGQTWLLMTGGIALTTMHSADFADIEGDRVRDRKTWPLVYGETAARWLAATAALAWSFYGLQVWGLQVWTVRAIAVQAVPVMLAMAMAVTFLAAKGKAMDKRGWRLCCYWVMSMYILPAFGTA